MIDYANFPALPLPSGNDLYRIHRSSQSPGYFGNSGDNRFEPPQGRENDFGVCYLGREPLAAYVEVFGSLEIVYTDIVSDRGVSTASLNQQLQLGDLTDRRVLGQFGITAEISTGRDYSESQQLAGSLFDAGFDGLLYRVRHDPSMELEAVALFGAPGSASRRDPRLEWFDPEPIPAELQERGMDFAILVQQRPTLS
ncbi:RES family NAD+ phosphorylase [Candidatus Poriferisodalis sp.]|uniref:RES family NAD+ phosphorylase n=1 Tax=Candidatus Poriferisodalis sp. TaxID=3101277 RepID=UPI003C6FD2F8